MSARSIRRNRERAEATDRRRQSRRARRASLATGAAIGATVIFAPGASAANFEVDTLADAGTGDCDAPLCLREAIEAADSNAEADAITFAPSLTGTIVLNGDQLGIYGDDALSITDDGPNEVTISGDVNEDDAPDSGDTRIFAVYSDAPVSFTDLTLTEGYVPPPQGPNEKYGGGAVFASYGAVVTVTDSTLTDNFGGFGGAVSSQGAEVTIAGSDLSDNSGFLGGGIFSSGAVSSGPKFDGPAEAENADAVESPSEAELTVVDSTISGNEAGFGGGVYSSGLKYSFATNEPPESSSDVTLTVSDSTISGNTAFEAGGGTLSKYSDTVISGSTVSDNEATGGSTGGIGGDAGILDISDSTISGNDALDGGAGGINAGKYATLTLADSQVTNNYAAYGGGGVLFDDDDDSVAGEDPDRSSEISRTTIAGNSAGYAGGGLYVGDINGDSSLLIAGSTISGNGAGDEADESFAGGGIAFGGSVSGNVRLSNSTVSGNSAALGGGVSVDEAYSTEEPPPEEARGASDQVNEGGSFVLANSTIAANTATDAGGGIYLGRYGTYNGETQETTYASSTVPLSSTIVADNNAGGSANDLAQTTEVDTPGGSFTLTRSLVENPGTATVTQDPAGSSILGTDPALGPLADNGGATRTHLPSQESIVIDVGQANGLTQDQRDQVRTIDFSAAGGSGDGTDIGSVEVQNRPNTRRLLREEVPADCVDRNPFDSAALALAGDGSNQTLQGTEGDDLLRAFGGDDTVLGVGGNDCLTGDEGTDIVEGGPGSDFGDGGPGEDLLTGGDGDDELRGSDGTDVLKLEAGDDTGIGGPGEDRLTGSDGDDALRGRFGNDRISGGADDDAIRGGGDDDRVSGGSGDDSLRGIRGDDLLIGGGGGDNLGGGFGDDVLKPGAGTDKIDCGGGDDVVKGASASDQIAANCEKVT